MYVCCTHVQYVGLVCMHVNVKECASYYCWFCSNEVMLFVVVIYFGNVRTYMHIQSDLCSLVRCFLCVSGFLVQQTGPKGVLSDYKRFEQVHKQEAAQEKQKHLKKMQQQAVTCQSAVSGGEGKGEGPGGTLWTAHRVVCGTIITVLLLLSNEKFQVEWVNDLSTVPEEVLKADQATSRQSYLDGHMHRPASIFAMQKNGQA